MVENRKLLDFRRKQFFTKSRNFPLSYKMEPIWNLHVIFSFIYELFYAALNTEFKTKGNHNVTQRKSRAYRRGQSQKDVRWMRVSVYALKELKESFSFEKLTALNLMWQLGGWKEMENLLMYYCVKNAKGYWDWLCTPLRLWW